MVIAYKMNPLTMWLMQRMALTDTVTLVNLVSETRVVPEFLGARLPPRPDRPGAVGLLMAGGPKRDAQIAAMQTTMQRLGKGGEAPGLRAARSVLAAISG